MKPRPPVLRSKPEVGTVPDSAEAVSPGRSEEQGWIEAARAGDTQAFRRLVERYGDRAYGLAFRMLGSASEAEEVAQDAFLRAWRALPRFRGESSFSTWLYRIVARRALDRSAVLKTRHAREVALEDADAVDLAEPVAGAAGLASADRSLLNRLLGSLSDVQRAVVMLYYYEDRSVEEVSRALGIPGGTVKTHLHRARALLRAGWMKAER